MLTKRHKFIFAATVLGAQVFCLRLFFPGWQYRAAVVVAAFSGLVLLMSLREDLNLLTSLLLPVLPAAFAAGATLFSFLLPNHWLVIMIFAGLFGLAMYAIFLTENVFGVAAIRTIQLVRAAQAVGFLFTILAALLIFNVLLSFRLSSWFNALGISLISLPLTFHAFWVIKLEPVVSRSVISRVGGVVLIMAQISFVLSFFPVSTTLIALFLTAVLYAAMGLVEQDYLKCMKSKTMIEYLGVVVIVLLVLLWQSSWRG